MTDFMKNWYPNGHLRESSDDGRIQGRSQGGSRPRRGRQVGTSVREAQEPGTAKVSPQYSKSKRVAKWVNKQLCYDYVLGRMGEVPRMPCLRNAKGTPRGARASSGGNRKSPRWGEGCVWGLETCQELRGREKAPAPTFARERAGRQGPPLADASLPFWPGARARGPGWSRLVPDSAFGTLGFGRSAARPCLRTSAVAWLSVT